MFPENEQEQSEKSTELEFVEAIDNKNLEEMKKLLARGVSSFRCICDLGYTPMEYAVEKGDLEIVRVLISSGFEISGGVSNSPPEIAVSANRMDIVLAFIEAGIDVNEPVYDGCDSLWTLLMSAATGGHLSIAKLLIERGADVNATTEKGHSALWYAARQGWLEMFNYLAPLTSPELREKAVQKLPDGLLYRQKEEDTLTNDFILSAGQGDIEAAKNSILAGVDINAINTRGVNALHFATLYNRLDIVKFLIEMGANVNAKDANGNTALGYAKRANNQEIVQLLLESGAKEY
jgi:uncharacterized protein